MNGTTTLHFHISNPNPFIVDPNTGQDASTISHISFTDSLGTLDVATPTNLQNMCAGATVNANSGDSSITVLSLQLKANASCDIFVDVTTSPDTMLGPVTNTTTAINAGLLGIDSSGNFIIRDVFSVGQPAQAMITISNVPGSLCVAPPTFPNLPITIKALDSCQQTLAFSALKMGESYIDVTNTGANGAAPLGPGFGGSSGNIFVNVYAFDPGEEMISCCSCLVTPDQTANLGVNRDLTVKTLTGVIPNSATVKLLSTLAGPGGTSSSCTNSDAMVTTAVIVPGMAAWGTTLHAAPPSGAFVMGERPFTPAMLSVDELSSIGGRCARILANGSSFDVCNSCQAGALGAAKQQ